jgi:hypothetical protein
MVEFRFLLICEGSSDGALVDHIERLLIHCGATGADGSSFHYGRYLKDKIRFGVDSFGLTDLLFIHRDADSNGSEARHSEIASEVLASEYRGPWIGVVPVTMLEAWLLGDEAAIRRVAGRPRSPAPLQLPRAAALEGIADPKGALREALFRAGDPSGVRRRKKFKAGIPGFRRQLVETLPIGGALEQLPAWVRFRDNVATVVSTWQDR